MKDEQGNKIKAKTMTQEQAQQVLERMVERTSKKIYHRALEFALEWSRSGTDRTTGRARSAKA